MGKVDLSDKMVEIITAIQTGVVKASDFTMDCFEPLVGSVTLTQE